MYKFSYSIMFLQTMVYIMLCIIQSFSKGTKIIPMLYKFNLLHTFFSCMIIRKLIITYFLSFNIVVQYNSDTMDF